MDKYLGKRLDGRYEMRELIGVGGMAYVYKAYDAIDDRTVAVKILRDEFLSNEEFTRRFRNESKAIAILNHPNIVKVLDVGFGERLQYIVMEYIDGITLKEYLDQRSDLRWKEAVHFTVQILRALQHAHDKGIVHRDIKPQNIMLLSDGTIKVTDFGIARLTRNELRATTENGDKAIGSVHYISPEQARGDITDEKTDLYAVGVMLYEMLTGRLPFEADNAVSVAIMQMQSEPTLPHHINEEIPEGLEQITMKAMQKDTAKRYQSAAEMLSDIDEFKRNPSIKFEYTYFVDEKPTRYVDAITRVRGEAPETAAEETEEETSTGKKISTVAILGAVAAAIVLVAVVFVLIFSKFFQNWGARQDIVVDNFVGMSYTDEVVTHENIGNYTVKDPQTGYNADYPEGYVYKQEPEAGDTIKMKGDLILYISLGSRLQEIPSMTPGESATMVRSRLKGEGFVVKEVEESSMEYKKGTVIRLSPAPGEKVQYGSEITMFVSSGEPVADPIPMPNVTNMAKNDAIDRLVEAGFDRNKVTITEVNDQAPKDTVIAVTPDYTKKQLPDVNIQLTVSTGFQNVEISMPMPDSETTVALQFFVAGKLDSALTAEYTSVYPKGMPNLNFTVKETKATYNVTVKIAKSGTSNFAAYYTFEVDGEEGTYRVKDYTPFDESNATTSATDGTGNATDTSATGGVTENTDAVGGTTGTTTPGDVSEPTNSETEA
ncbi:MAG: Stk1 family PASTA domain-containing Ser/Thr kinase [Clostridia bacterium]|nr:Stk1 family PASTA domain-containing Ser/Thr kinase [Clostridia bacterium]